MKELFCLLYCFVLFKRVEPFSYVRIRDKDFEPADVKLFFRLILLYCTTNLYNVHYIHTYIILDFIFTMLNNDFKTIHRNILAPQMHVGPWAHTRCALWLVRPCILQLLRDVAQTKDLPNSS